MAIFYDLVGKGLGQYRRSDHNVHTSRVLTFGLTLLRGQQPIPKTEPQLLINS